MQAGRKRAFLGLALIILSYPLGWPAVGVFAGLAIYLKEPLMGVVGGTAVYVFSWLVLLAGIWLAGKESYRRLRESGVKAVWRGIVGDGK